VPRGTATMGGCLGSTPEVVQPSGSHEIEQLAPAKPKAPPASSHDGVEAVTKAVQEMRANAAVNLQLSSLSIEDAGLEMLAQELPKSERLEHLNLGVNSLTDSGLESLALSLPQTRLKVLSLERNNFTSTGVQLLSKSLPPTLEKLMLGRNNVAEAGAKALAECLMQRQPLAALGLQFASLHEPGIRALKPALHKVKVLDVAGNHLEVIGAATLAEGLRGGSGLEVLKLESNGVGDEGAKALGDAVATHTALRRLELRRNSITDKGVHFLTQSLQRSRALQELDLFDNSITDVGAADLLKLCPNLKALDLQINDVSEEMMTKVAQSLKK